MKNRRNVRPFVMFGLLGLLVASMIGLARGPLNMTPRPISGVAELEKKTRLTFPRAAQVIEGNICHCWEAYAYAKMRISPHDVGPFFRQPPFKGQTSTSDITIFPTVAPADLRERWQLARVKHFVSAEGGDLYLGGKAQALVDLDDPERPLLYVLWQHD